MNFFARPKHNGFCAFCRTPRWIARRRHVGFVNLLASALAALALTLAVWQEFEPRGFIFFAAFAAFAEIFVQLRWRLAVICKVCGFDPVTYMKNPNLAAEKVKNRLEERRRDDRMLLARPLNLPTLSPERAKAVGKRNLEPGSPGI